MWWDGDNVMGKIEVLDTPSGQILKQLVKYKVKLGISSRGMGSTSQKDGVTMVEDDYQLICFDIVSEPSTPGAYLNQQVGAKTININPTIGKYINEATEKTKEERINSLFKTILGD
jgi:hypothetical protein